GVGGEAPGKGGGGGGSRRAGARGFSGGGPRRRFAPSPARPQSRIRQGKQPPHLILQQAWVGEQPVIGADDPPPLAPVGPRGLAYGGWELGRVLGDVRPIDNPKPDQAPCERPRAEPELEFCTQTPVEEVGEPFRITVGQNPSNRIEI